MAKSRARKLADIIVGAGIDIDGNLTFDGGSTSADLTFADNDKANFGDASDLQIYHDGSASYIKEAGTGDFIIQGSNTLRLQGSSSQELANFGTGGAVTLFHNNSAKFATTSTGVTVTGGLVATSTSQFTDINIPDNNAARFGDSQEFQIYHTGSGNSIISETGSGSLYLDATNIYLRKSTASGETMGAFVADGAATLYYDNSAKLATFSGGVSVTGQLNATTMHLPDGSTGLQLGASNDTKFFHDGNNSKITHSGSGGFYIGANTFAIQKGDHSENYLAGFADGTVEIYHNGVKKVETTSAGIDVTGSIDVTSSASYGVTANRGFKSTADIPNFTLVESDASGQTWQINSTGAKLSFRDISRQLDRLVIDTAGRVGIGTTSPSTFANYTNISIKGGSSGVNLDFHNASGARRAALVSSDAGLIVETNTTATPIMFKIGATPTERMRIDSSGNLLVGKSSADDFSSAGAQIEAGGQITSSVASAPSLRLNRGGTDGDIIELNKAGTTVGSIANDSTSLVVTGSSTGLKFGSAAIWPTTGGGVTNSNGAKDLGASTVRFKDLYLSNKVYAAYIGEAGDTNTSINFDTADSIKFVTGGAERGRFDSTGLYLANDAAITRAYRTLYNGSAAANTVQYIKLYDRGTTTAGQQNLHFYMRGFNHSEYSVEVKIFIPTYSGFTTSYGTMDAGQGIEVEIICGGLSSQGNVFQEIIEVANLSSTTDNTEIWLKTQVPHATTGISISEAADSTDTLIPTGDGSGWTTTAPSNQHRVFPIKIGKTINGIHTTRDSKLGIGTSTPAGSLHLRDTAPHLYIQSDDGQSAKLLFGDATDNSRGGIEYMSTDDMQFMNNNLSTVMTLRYTGQVGIGETNPNQDAAVEIAKAAPNTGVTTLRLTNSVNNKGQRIDFEDDNAARAFTLAHDNGSNITYMGNLVNEPFAFYTNNAERMRIASSNPYMFLGNTGHGWGTFHAVAQIGRTGAVATYDSGANQQTIIANNTYYGGSGYTSIEGTTGASYMNVTQGQVRFYTAPSITAGSAQTFTQRLKITNAGNVGIGADSPASALSGSNTNLTIEDADGADIKLKRTAGMDLSVGVTSSNTGYLWTSGSYNILFGTAGTERMRIDSGGNIGVGTSSLYGGTGVTSLTIGSTQYPSLALQVNGTNAHIITGYSNNLSFDAVSTRYIRFNTNGIERMRIDASTKNVGIGTSTLSAITSNVATLSLGGINAGVSGGIAYQTNGTAEAYHYTQDDMLLHQAVAGVGQRFLTNNTERMRIDTSGNVSIGVTSASARLDVRGGSGGGTLTHAVFTGTTNRGAEIRTRSDISGGQYSGCAEFNSADSEGDGGDIALSSNGNVRMFIHGTGKVGIGTTAPATGTHTSYQNLVIGETSSSTSGLSFKASTSGQSAIFFSDGVSPFNRGQVLYDHSTDSLTLASNGVEKLRLDGSGQTNVRLGGSTTNGTTLISSCTSTSSSGGAGTGNYLELEAMEPNNPNYGAKKLRLGVQGGGYVKMTMPGAAGLFIESPYQTADKIHVGYAGIQLDMNGGGFGGNQHMLIRCNNDIMFHPGGSERWRMIAPTGSTPSVFVTNQTTVTNIGGTPPDLNSIEIGPGYINLNRDDTVSATQIQFGKNGSVAGSIVTTSSTTYNTTSDRRAKENIVDAQDAGELIDSIQVREFDWKNSGEHQRYGMVAQELLEVAPEVVHQPEDEEQMMGVDYSKLVPMLVKEIQSLRARVAELEGE